MFVAYTGANARPIGPPTPTAPIEIRRGRPLDRGHDSFEAASPSSSGTTPAQSPPRYGMQTPGLSMSL